MKIVAFSSLSLLALSSAFAQSLDNGLDNKMRQQSHIDTMVPLSESHWVGTHNTTNSKDWNNVYVNVNQKATPQAQLESGARWVEYDVYQDWNNSKHIVAHDASELTFPFFGYKSWGTALEEIRDFLQSPNNQDEVIFLKLQFEVGGGRPEVWDKLNSKLGAYLYRSIDFKNSNLNDDSEPGDCTMLDAARLSKKIVRDAGKNVVVFTSTKSCSGVSNGSLQDTFFVYNKMYEKVAGTKIAYPRSYKNLSLENCQAYATDPEVMFPNLNLYFTMDSRYDGVVEKNHDADTGIRVSEIPDFEACGINAYETFNYEGGANLDPVSLWDAPVAEREDYLWSWGENVDLTNSGKRCAFVDKRYGYVDAERCNVSRQYLCRKTDGEFFLTGIYGKSGTNTDDSENANSLGHFTCDEISAGAKFVSVANPQQLQEAITLAQGHTWNSFYINYDDKDNDGQWEVPNSAYWMPNVDDEEFITVNIMGDSADNSLEGSGSRDVIFGFEGSDEIRGHGGDDVMSGGAAGDVFYFRFDSKNLKSGDLGNATVLDYDETQDMIKIKMTKYGGSSALDDFTTSTSIRVYPDRTLIYFGTHENRYRCGSGGGVDGYLTLEGWTYKHVTSEAGECLDTESEVERFWRLEASDKDSGKWTYWFQPRSE